MSVRCDESVASRERELADAIEPFSFSPPELLLERKLLHRTDSKFILRVDALADILVQLRRDYTLVRAGTRRLGTYRTLYFDTPELECFNAHRRGRRPRHKIRLRHYPERGVSYFEIKTKKSDAITQKVRTDVEYGCDTLSERALALLDAHGPVLPGPLEPQIWTNFHRLTLVGLHSAERITFDFDLRVGPSGALCEIGGLVIAEVKQQSFSTHTPVMAVLRNAGMRPTSASKYCTAMALTREGLRLNRLLPSIRAIERMTA